MRKQGAVFRNMIWFPICSGRAGKKCFKILNKTNIIIKLSASLFDTKQNVHIHKNTKAFKLYGTDKKVEQFRCNYGLNSIFINSFVSSGILISGVDIEQTLELLNSKNIHFFLATLFSTTTFFQKR